MYIHINELILPLTEIGIIRFKKNPNTHKLIL